MQTLTTADRAVVVAKYYMTIMDENANWIKLAPPLLVFLNPRAPFCTSTLMSIFLINFYVHTRDK